ncbi:hypothetical protein FC25_GL001760 [Ligilactobacillus ruminis DSM 20403 = NBRC 102161]|nr:hypothetical protein FC25_GL001760 [Ligilactobacillus ruminis DSM 20403 = NBRC 102161]
MGVQCEFFEKCSKIGRLGILTLYKKARMKFAIGCKASELLFESDFFPASFYLETSSAVTFYFF